ncbi:hypothetical protein [Bacillus pumilus]|uniref:hypothetical protein n=1 Tax=Bacillus pumilus TaxID=1408 RepID=UPI0016425180|nr:hypothetical protein [Bacillus pumilus]
MKTLDAFALINGIDQTLNTLKQQVDNYTAWWFSKTNKKRKHHVALDSNQTITCGCS